MKKNILTAKLMAAVVLCIVFVGCNKAKTSDYCNGCNDMDCEEYAPAGVSVSWTDYNTPSELTNYFACHRATLTEHLNDTIKLAGWVYFCDHESGNPDFGEWDINRGWLLLVDDRDNPDYHHHAWVKWTKDFEYFSPEDSIWLAAHPNFRDHFNEYLQKKWYVVAVVNEKILYSGCCDHNPQYKIVDIDTIP